jgi:glycogen synthase kinase 3 beta
MPEFIYLPIQLFAKSKPDPELVDLIGKLLKYPPKERLRPLEAMLHPFFNELRQESFSLANTKLPDFFDFNEG